MKVGFGSLTCQRGPGDRRSDGERYREALELAAAAERLGFHSVWLSEHHFFADGYTPSLLVLASAIAARSDHIAIGTGVLLAPLHNPVRLVEDAATTQLLSGGRLTLGIGQGWRRDEFDGLGIPFGGRHLRLEEIVRTLRKEWRDGPVTPKPDPPPPIWIGGMSEPAVRRAAAATDAQQIRADGSGTATTIVDWVAAPHFFLKGRVMVIYAGNDQAVVSLLRRLLGPQFAGS